MLTRWVLRQYAQIFRFSRWMRVHFTVMGHLCLAVWLIAGIFGVDIKSSQSYQLFVFLSIVLLFALLGCVINGFKATLKRQLPRYVTVGESFSYSVRVTNSTGKNYHDLVYIEHLHEVLPEYAELADFYQREHTPWYRRAISFRLWRRYLIYRRGGYIEEQPLSMLSAQQTECIKVSCTPLRRGQLNFSGAYIAKADLLGLFRRLYFAAEQQRCLVLPKRYEVAALNLIGKRQYQSGGVSLANSVGDSAEFMSLREYRQGDALNDIHWKSFARHGRLIVKEYQDEYFVRRALLLDTYQGTLSNELFEAAVSVAASLVMSERQQDALLDLMFVGQAAYRFTSGRGVDHMSHLQEVLAAVQPSDAASFERLKKAVAEHTQQCSGLLCVLLHWDQARQDCMRSLRAQGLAVAVFLIHDGSMDMHDIEQPEHFYLINARQIAADLAAL